MKKMNRQNEIKQLIERRAVERQEDLVTLLSEVGYNVTQATVSRDIKELKLIKVPTSDGGYRYSLPTRKAENEDSQFRESIRNYLQVLKQSERFVSLTMHPGHGPVVAMLINRLDFPEVFTAIGDDSTVLVVCESDKAATQFVGRLEKMRLKNVTRVGD